MTEARPLRYAAVVVCLALGTGIPAAQGAGPQPPALPRLALDRLPAPVRAALQAAYDAAETRAGDASSVGHLGMVLHAHGQYLRSRGVLSHCPRGCASVDVLDLSVRSRAGGAWRRCGCRRFLPGVFTARAGLCTGSGSAGRELDEKRRARGQPPRGRGVGSAVSRSRAGSLRTRPRQIGSRRRDGSCGALPASGRVWSPSLAPRTIRSRSYIAIQVHPRLRKHIWRRTVSSAPAAPRLAIACSIRSSR